MSRDQAKELLDLYYEVDGDRKAFEEKAANVFLSTSMTRTKIWLAFDVMYEECMQVKSQGDTK